VDARVERDPEEDRLQALGFVADGVQDLGRRERAAEGEAVPGERERPCAGGERDAVEGRADEVVAREGVRSPAKTSGSGGTGAFPPQFAPSVQFAVAGEPPVHVAANASPPARPRPRTVASR
jgi:hypothetical protein